jgi:hypothetical protein
VDGVSEQPPDNGNGTPPDVTPDETGVTEHFTLTRPLMFWQLQEDIEAALGREVRLGGTSADNSLPTSTDNPMDLAVSADDAFSDEDKAAIQDILDNAAPRDLPGPPPVDQAPPPSSVVVTPPADDTDLQGYLDSLAAGNTLTTAQLSAVLRAFVTQGSTS